MNSDFLLSMIGGQTSIGWLKIISPGMEECGFFFGVANYFF